MEHYQQILSGMKNDQGNHSTSRQEQNLSVFLKQLSQIHQVHQNPKGPDHV